MSRKLFFIGVIFSLLAVAAATPFSVRAVSVPAEDEGKGAGADNGTIRGKPGRSCQASPVPRAVPLRAI